MSDEKVECNKCKKMVDRELACELELEYITVLCNECLSEEFVAFSEQELKEYLDKNRQH